jgi:hypothetical protein
LNYNYFIQFQVLQLKRQCRSLEGELESVKSEIVKILREKAGSLEENGILKEYKTSYEELAYENKQRKSQILKMVENTKSDNESGESVTAELLDRSSPDGQEIIATHQQTYHWEDGTSLSQSDESMDINKKLDSKPRIR